MIRPEDLARIAQLMLRGTTETEWRTATGRAYYAAFHATRNFLQELGFNAPRADAAHAYLWRRLLSCGVTSLGSTGSRLYELRQQRNVADYEIQKPFSRDRAETACDLCREIMQVLNSVSDAERAEAIETMCNFERSVLGEQTWRGKPR